VAYANAASAENDPVEIALMRIDQMMDSILATTKADTFRGFLSGSNNFRHEIYPKYKANRKDMVSPRWRNACKEYLVREWDAEVTNGYEADDAMGINQTKDTIICTIDKDLQMIPGMHYSWPIVRGGLVVREAKIHEVSEIEGLKSFYRSCLVGDRTDNIFGVDGIGPVKAAKAIDHLETEEEMFDRVAEIYGAEYDRFIVNAKCLWIMREENKIWEPPKKRLEVFDIPQNHTLVSESQSLPEVETESGFTMF